jgi:hypothetical protein
MGRRSSLVRRIQTLVPLCFHIVVDQYHPPFLLGDVFALQANMDRPVSVYRLGLEEFLIKISFHIIGTVRVFVCSSARICRLHGLSLEWGRGGGG